MKIDKDTLDRIAQAIRNNKPKMIDGKAMYVGTHYESLDDAYDWWQNDLEFVRFDVKEMLEETA